MTKVISQKPRFYSGGWCPHFYIPLMLPFVTPTLRALIELSLFLFLVVLVFLRNSVQIRIPTAVLSVLLKIFVAGIHSMLTHLWKEMAANNALMRVWEAQEGRAGTRLVSPSFNTCSRRETCMSL